MREDEKSLASILTYFVTKLDNYFLASVDRQTFLGFHMTSNSPDTFSLIFHTHEGIDILISLVETCQHTYITAA